MRNPFLISNQFRIKHKILEVLYEETKVEGHQVGSLKIAEVTNIPIAQINKWHQSQISADEITTVNNDGHFMITITPKYNILSLIFWHEEKVLHLFNSQINIKFVNYYN